MMQQLHGERRRRGIAIMFAVVVLAMLGAIAGTAIWQFLAGRHALERRANVIQARWLARSAASLTAAKLAEDRNAIPAESVDLLTGWNVQVQVEQPGTDKNLYRMQTTATTNAEDRSRVSVQFHWIVRLDGDARQFTLEREESDNATDRN